MRKILLFFLLITSITIIGCSSDSGSSSSPGPGPGPGSQDESKSIKVATNGYTVYTITTDDKLYAWGYNGDGQIGNGSKTNQTTPYEVTGIGKVKSVVTTDYHDGSTVYVITEDDRLYAWGYNKYGQVGNGKSGVYDNGSVEKATTPYEVVGVGKVKSVVTDNHTVYAITTDDKLYAWGYNGDGQVGNGSTASQTTPYEVKAVGKVKSVVTNGYTVYAITTDDKLYAWGYNEHGQVGNGSTTNQTSPHEVTEVGTVKSVVTRFKTYGSTVYAITTDDKLYAWGYNNCGQVGNGSKTDQTKPYKVQDNKLDLPVKDVVTYHYTVYAITTDDKLYAWGENHHGQIGNGSTSNQTTPCLVTGIGTVKSVVTDDDGYTVYAITTDDKLYAWGRNEYGEVGNGKSGDVKTPSLVTGIGTVKSVVTYLYTVYAITTDDKLYAWGLNYYGQVGNGESGDDIEHGGYKTQKTPYEVKEVGTVKSVVTDFHTVYAITTDNKLYAWGRNKDGQVGNGGNGVYVTTPFNVILK